MAEDMQTWIDRERARGRPAEPSQLEELFALLETAGPLKISFEDLSGVARDIPPLRLSAWEQQHTCDFCIFAKGSVGRNEDCGLNKYAVNRLVLRRAAGFHGQCHLGLTDIVQPLMFYGRVLGIFYYGSVIVEGTEVEARERILKYCKRRGYPARPYLEQLSLVPRISEIQLQDYIRRLKLVANLSSSLLESWGLPEERYHAEIIGPLWADPHKFRNLSTLVQSAVRYIQKHYSEPLRVTDIATALGCNPVYLSQTFKKNMECELIDYLQLVRIDHARQRLKYSTSTISEIGYEVGFQEKSHFGKVFKKFVHLTPGEYRRQQARPAADVNLSHPL